MKSIGTLLSESGYVSREDLDSFVVFDESLGDFSDVCKCYRLSPAASADISSSPGNQQGSNHDLDRNPAPVATDKVFESEVQPTNIKLERANEEDRKPPPAVTDEVLESDHIPANDIKLGRGKPLQSHPGNIWFRKRIARELPEYDGLGDQQKKQKVDMKKNIYQSITSTSRKFWKAHKERKGFWKMAGEACVLEKIAYSLRSERKKKKEEEGRRKKKERAEQPL